MVSLEVFNTLVDYAYEEAVDDLGGSWSAEYFMEAGESGGGLFSRIIESVKKFFSQLINAAAGFFKTIIEKVKGIKGLNRSARVQIPKKYQDLIDQGKISSKELDGCKTEEDLERVIKKFRKKKVAIMAGTTVGVLSAAGAVAYITKRSGASKKELEQERAAIEKDIAAIQEDFEAESKVKAKENAEAKTAEKFINAQQKQEDRENAAKHRLAQSKANATINKAYSAQENRRLAAEGRLSKVRENAQRKIKFAQMKAKYKMEVAAARQNAEQSMISQIGAKLAEVEKHNADVDYVRESLPKTVEQALRDQYGQQAVDMLNVVKDPNADPKKKEKARAWLLSHGGASKSTTRKKKGGMKTQVHYKSEKGVREGAANSADYDEFANRQAGDVTRAIGSGSGKRILTSTHQKTTQ